MSRNLLESIRDEQKNWPWEEKARKELNEKEPGTTEKLLLEFKDKIQEYAKEHKNFRPQVRTLTEFQKLSHPVLTSRNRSYSPEISRLESSSLSFESRQILVQC